MPQFFTPVLFMLSSTLSLSLTGLLTKFLSQDFSPEQLSFLRFVIPAIILLFIMCVTTFRKPPRDMVKPLWIRAVCIAACQVCFIYALQVLTLVESVVLFSTGPLFIPVLEKLIFSVRVQWLTIASLALTFCGVLFLAGDPSGIQFRPELLIGLLAGLFNAGSQLSLYRVSKGNMRAMDINAWTFAYAAVLLMPVLFLGADGMAIVGRLSNFNGVAIASLLAVSLLIINTQIFRSKAYKLASSGSQLAPLIFTNLLFTAIWQATFFNESFSVYQLIGLGLIVFASMLNILIPRLIRLLKRRSNIQWV
ncbi:EamA family transporter [Vibrio sp. SCSIO 43135]|uniref:DMT family transporter n=1 Tax=Vibrio sp. SCSIO 43135 TaxID=2819096 RepID=UPI00207609CD|nr:DMT family transporter [Vibrio sp. SCSIO 43135]USD43044.1 EamA family transporter [Vibrio sp. SCSIO 43135]